LKNKGVSTFFDVDVVLVNWLQKQLFSQLQNRYSLLLMKISICLCALVYHLLAFKFTRGRRSGAILYSRWESNSPTASWHCYYFEPSCFSKKIYKTRGAVFEVAFLSRLRQQPLL